MNGSVRNHLLSDKLVELQRRLQTSWISGCTKSTGAFPEPVLNVENCWALPKSSLTSSYLNKAIRSGSQKLETIPLQDDAIHSPFIPQYLSQKFFLIWILVWATGAVSAGQQANISHKSTLLYPLADRNTNFCVNFNAGRLFACTSSKVPKIQIVFFWTAKHPVGRVLFYLTPFSSNNQRHFCCQYSESHFNDEIVALYSSWCTRVCSCKDTHTWRM